MFKKPYFYAAFIVCSFLWYLIITQIIEALNKL